jgi:hypothetical protein
VRLKTNKRRKRKIPIHKSPVLNTGLFYYMKSI